MTGNMSWQNLKFEPCKMADNNTFSFQIVNRSTSFILTITSIFPVKIGSSTTSENTQSPFLCDSFLIDVIWLVSINM